eukprot:TRINITY_DN105149_c0_g1_i1.p2 TRINITY_DN105149_c0_g1~~TRINITY_DN105149_c0_g1_i1.p2  ORF type:complete len:1065 (+),score=106.10 TRINITY_DN105149_c0_g1_i1:9590-12784(+)
MCGYYIYSLHNKTPSKRMEEVTLKLPRKRSRAVDNLREYLEAVEESNESEFVPTPKQSLEPVAELSQDIIFKPFRAVGLICDNLGFIYHRNIPEKQFTVSVGHAFQTYSLDNLRLIYVSPHISARISALGVYKDFVFTACDNEIYMWSKAHSRATLAEHKAELVNLLVVGDTLLSLDKNGKMIVWGLPGCNKVGEIQVPGKGLIMHPPTYLFKVLIAGGRELELWNVNTFKKIYDFPTIRAVFDSNIKVLEESVVVDVVAIGLESGRIIVANIKTDKILLSFEAGSKITSLSFSHPESGIEYSLLAASTTAGDVVLYDLNAKRVHTTIKAHNSKCVEKAFFIPGEPLLLSSSGDANSIKVWIFEKGQIKPRVLRFREGADGPANCLKFYGDGGKDLIAACGDNAIVQSISLISDHQNSIFSTNGLIKDKNITKAIKKTKALAFSKYREYDWSNIITCHYGTAECHLWSYERKAIQADPKLETHIESNATTVQVTNCGNFCVIGYSNGQLCKLNMQSGLHRGCFKGGHTKAVSGIGVDPTNKFMVSAAVDGKISFWDFYTCGLAGTLDTVDPIEHFVYHPKNGLAAFVNSKSELKILDGKTRKIVRNFGIAHDSKITDLCFSHDGKWVVSAAADRSLKVWDIMLGILINWITLPKAITSMDFSPTGDCLATGLVGEKGVFLWSNMCMYTHLTLNKSPTAPAVLALPHFAEMVHTNSRKAFYQSKSEAEPMTDQKDEWKSLIKKNEENGKDLIEFSKEPFTKWQTIYNLETIKEKNKPVEQPKDLPQAPFFLYDINEDKDNNLGYKDLLIDQSKEKEDKKRILKGEAIEEGVNELIKLLKALVKSVEGKERIYNKITSYLKDISGSRSELEFTELNSLTGEYKEEVSECIDYFIYAIKQKRDYELIQAHLHVFLKNCPDMLQLPENERKMKTLLEAQNKSWIRMEKDLVSSAFLVDFFSGVQLTQLCFAQVIHDNSVILHVLLFKSYKGHQQYTYFVADTFSSFYTCKSHKHLTIKSPQFLLKDSMTCFAFLISFSISTFVRSSIFGTFLSSSFSLPSSASFSISH